MNERRLPTALGLFGELFEDAGREVHYLATRWPLPRRAPRTDLGLVGELVSYPAWLAVAVYGPPGWLVLWQLWRPSGRNALGGVFWLLYQLLCPLGVGCVLSAAVLRVLAYRKALGTTSRQT